MLIFAMIAAVVVASGVIALVLTGDAADGPRRLAPAQHAELTQWWATAYPEVTKLEEALDNSEHALERLDAPALAAACQRMHDSAAVDIAAHLPSPDRELTAELNAATEDAHDASHMCMAVIGGTTNQYDAEFVADIEQANRHLKAAVAIVNRYLTQEPRWSARK
ncbi:hypothetical protein A4X20_16205 [Mycolicibacterium iranicum]|uniref:Uncharacterized protein n=2 Tax=Mycolicibacterium iranicum TaxID=912594 RepID=A0A178LYV6_MYCIR|nr:hypothetical protein A4X20_16205 [Mycolicibacterium iranicum]